MGTARLPHGTGRSGPGGRGGGGIRGAAARAPAVLAPALHWHRPEAVAVRRVYRTYSECEPGYGCTEALSRRLPTAKSEHGVVATHPSTAVHCTTSNIESRIGTPILFLIEWYCGQRTKVRTALTAQRAVTMEGSLFVKLGTVLELQLIVEWLDEDDAFAFASTCRDFHAAIGYTGSDTTGALTRPTTLTTTSVKGVWASVARLRWAVLLGYRMNVRHFARAAGMGRLEVLQWARANDCDFDWRTCEAAAGGGHQLILQWARANGCEWSESTCAAAACGGHLAVLQWARERGCPWGRWTCHYAAAGGHVAVLQWARANGCEWDAYTCAKAAKGGHLEVFQWARANGCE